jgi:hypothetical protein
LQKLKSKIEIKNKGGILKTDEKFEKLKLNNVYNKGMNFPSR